MANTLKVVDTSTGRSDRYQVKLPDGEIAQGFSAAEISTILGVTVDATGSVAAASSTVAGKVELAIDSEAVTGTDTVRAITPANLKAAATTHVSAASDTAAGKVELATSAEAIAVTDAVRAVTPYGLGAVLAKLYLISFTGSNGAGACTATGAAVSDAIFAVAGLTDMGQFDADFEISVSVINQIQQSSVSNYSAKNFIALVYRPS